MVRELSYLEKKNQDNYSFFFTTKHFQSEPFDYNGCSTIKYNLCQAVAVQRLKLCEFKVSLVYKASVVLRQPDLHKETLSRKKKPTKRNLLLYIQTYFIYTYIYISE